MKKLVTCYGISFSLLITALIAGCGSEETASAGTSDIEILRNVVATAGEKLEAGMEANDLHAAVSQIVQVLDDYEARSCFKPYLGFYSNLEVLESKAKNSTEDELKGMVAFLKNQATEILVNPGS